MVVQVTPPQLLHFAHGSAAACYRDCLADLQAVFDRYAISASPLRVAHFYAQVLCETAALSALREDLYYRAARIVAVWPTRFQPRGCHDPYACEHNPEALADAVYGRRMGNHAQGDGFTYRGRGLLQLTGKDGYRHATDAVRGSMPGAPDLVEQPDMVVDPQWCLTIAAAVWRGKGCNEHADHDNLYAVTRAINGGMTDLADRQRWLRLTKQALRVDRR